MRRAVEILPSCSFARLLPWLVTSVTSAAGEGWTLQPLLQLLLVSFRPLARNRGAVCNSAFAPVVRTHGPQKSIHGTQAACAADCSLLCLRLSADWRSACVQVALLAHQCELLGRYTNFAKRQAFAVNAGSLQPSTNLNTADSRRDASQRCLATDHMPHYVYLSQPCSCKQL